MAITEIKKSLSAKLQDLKSQYELIDFKLDDESITDEEYDRLDAEAIELSRSIAKLENQLMQLSCKELKPKNEWFINFLNSFKPGCYRITINQANIFRKYINNYDHHGLATFIFNGCLYCVEAPNYKFNSSAISIEKII